MSRVLQSAAALRGASASFFVLMAFVCAACGSGGGGGSSSSAATATVAAPIIATQPQAARVNDGQPASFAVSAVSSVAVNYQWSRNGIAIAGANAATYTIASAQLSDDGAAFSVAVSSTAGTVQSTSATLNVSAVAPTIANNAPMTVSVAFGQPATFRVSASGSAPLTFQWRRGGVALAGATGASYTTPATVAADNGAVFDVVVTNAAGTAVSAPFTLVVTNIPQAPTIAQQPQSLSVRLGEPASFTVVAAGTAPFSYQWLRNGSPIAGAQSATFTLPSTTLADNGAQFSVVVTNIAGSVTSATATLTVAAQAAIALAAGSVGGPGTIDGPGTSARFALPIAVALDNAGSIFVADASTVRRIAADGNVTTFAGSPTTAGFADGAAAAATFSNVAGIATDAAGNLYIVDNLAHTVRKISTAGVVTTLAGTAGVTGSNDGAGTAARFNAPNGIAVDASGNLYVADSGNQTIRKVTPAGNVTTLAGSPGVVGSADGLSAGASFSTPSAVVVDGGGNLFVADSGNATIRRITPNGTVTTLAGLAGARGAVDGAGNAARFNLPFSVAIDGSGTLYVGDAFNQLVRKVTPAGVVTTLAGSGAIGAADGTGRSASFSLVTGLASDSGGNLVVADRDNSVVRTVTPQGVVTTLAGAARRSGSADGARDVATFMLPYGVAVAGDGTLFVTDASATTVRRVTPAGVVSTLAGLAGASGNADGTGAAARFGSPRGIGVNAAGTAYVADFLSNTIRAISPGGVVTTLAGNPLIGGSADGTGSAARFDGPSGVVVDAAGNLFVTDAGNGTVRKITPAGVVTTFAGTAGQVGAADGSGGAASFNSPTGIAIDSTGTLFVSDTGNSTIRRITPAGVVTTLAGTAGRSGASDGPAAVALFNMPLGIAVDASGNVYVAEVANRTVRRIDGAGNVTTLVGTANGRIGVRLGALPGSLSAPLSLAVDAAGTLYLTDVNGVLTITR